ncbi:twin-arginine translocase TatA/TatE family subunit [Paenibacillus melissococcoides]|uniref:Sec-independent protein translocase protein TatA n=1 Tax=Paenibacillus melissococcoides TaxID=2912268 RepID=A0ABM9G8B9_9BACL|nr:MULTISPECIES: twin-arginine translocase TatA/TatE family subunit [Paenibacillus]MEB9896756.1 twin-arginine translocase TatA/TatE family subunit [Bacillus cereus]TDL58104.1 twin-arginine translocase TatA/TatE family subunit [Paenibacillus dendritiformis]CAH8248001.1 twin-arginine translocase TatA/TatE family subunit [Paenibacillus melissococcoides]CAH8718908.1 twin-arginine translocase TatA/TatE family subunit [Paenibacillus melissococcoides]CAH8719912.1 twin-arginine translocase TatA/TatE f
MLNNIGISGLVIILMLALMLFGPAKLPQLGRAFGDTLREFRNSTRGLTDDGKEEEDRETIELKKLP